MEQKRKNKLKWALGLAAGTAVLLAGYFKSRQKGETLYKLSVFTAKEKEAVEVYAKGILESCGWAFHRAEEQGENGEEVLVFYVLLAKEEELNELIENIKTKWPLVSVFCTKEEKPYRRL